MRRAQRRQAACLERASAPRLFGGHSRLLRAQAEGEGAERASAPVGAMPRFQAPPVAAALVSPVHLAGKSKLDAGGGTYAFSEAVVLLKQLVARQAGP
ncbi:hypothetical protein CYMTET_33227 [Cymbomonas tetramitiformis]|uniref:Uncharacterized protein n=1 Tax=Cymbomonas tetramitiformis TaxID=36881 RepID=A0AAE0FDP8_9CHLO|nr:hypothetical protein CYMTET_33227 [Cymbomonas tetramitiformis]